MYSIIVVLNKKYGYGGNVVSYLNLSTEDFVKKLFKLTIWNNLYPERQDYFKTLSYDEFVELAKEQWSRFLKYRWEEYNDFFILEHSQDLSIHELRLEDLDLNQLDFFPRCFKYQKTLD